jgi:hypothetical protein
MHFDIITFRYNWQNEFRHNHWSKKWFCSNPLCLNPFCQNSVGAPSNSAKVPSPKSILPESGWGKKWFCQSTFCLNPFCQDLVATKSRICLNPFCNLHRLCERDKCSGEEFTNCCLVLVLNRSSKELRNNFAAARPTSKQWNRCLESWYAPIVS